MERAWALFVGSGHDRRTGDPAALSVRGRLLKDRARRAHGAERAALFAQAAEAYGAAHGLSPAPYLALNLATTRLLAGDRDGAEAAARAVLDLLDAPKPPADTPYYLAATRAEALLLLGDVAGAQAAMAEAAQRDPDGWDDRAVTLGQLAEIHAAQGLDSAWLDGFRPPATLHFAGHLALESGGTGEAALAQQVDSLLADHHIGLACGTIAAGCDIVIAERILARGGTLHLFLPSPPDLFAAQSVAPGGAGWEPRYRALLQRAEAVCIMGDADAAAGGTPLHDPLATELAGQIAIGAALVRARMHATRAFQLIALDPAGGGPSSKALADHWPLPETGLRLSVPRETDVRVRFAGDMDDPHRRLAAVLHIAFDAPCNQAADWQARAEPVWQALRGIPATQIGASAQSWQVRIDDPADAARLALAVLDHCIAANGAANGAGNGAANGAGNGAGSLALPTIGAAYGIVSEIIDQPSARAIPLGPVPAAAHRLARTAQDGTIIASECLALVLAARQAQGLCCEWLHDGEGRPGDAVYSVIPAR